MSADALDAALRTDPSISHAFIHCETGTGVSNPSKSVGEVCLRHVKGLIVDAMSSFPALPIDARQVTFDALIAARGMCPQGVPGMAFVFLRRAVPAGCDGRSHSLAMHLFDQHTYMEKARLARYADNIRTLVDGLTALGLTPFLRPEVQATIIVTWHAPARDHYDFKRFYEAAKRRGFLFYPGKLTQLETFRVGCISAIGRNEMQRAVNAVEEALRQMGLARQGLVPDTV